MSSLLNFYRLSNRSRDVGEIAIDQTNLYELRGF